MDFISQDLPPQGGVPLADAEACYQAVLVEVPALLAQNRLLDAENLLVTVLSRYPDMAEAHGNLGVIFRHQGRLAESERHLRQALKSRPDYPEALSNLGAVLLDRGQLAEADVPALVRGDGPGLGHEQVGERGLVAGGDGVAYQLGLTHAARLGELAEAVVGLPVELDVQGRILRHGYLRAWVVPVPGQILLILAIWPGVACQ